jgi:hypothetical protein
MNDTTRTVEIRIARQVRSGILDYLLMNSLGGFREGVKTQTAHCGCANDAEPARSIYRFFIPSEELLSMSPSRERATAMPSFEAGYLPSLLQATTTVAQIVPALDAEKR